MGKFPLYVCNVIYIYNATVITKIAFLYRVWGNIYFIFV